MSKTIVHIALFFVALIYGANYTIAKEVMPRFMTPLGFLCIRVLVATALFWTFGLLFSKPIKFSRNEMGRIFVCGLFGAGLNMICYFKGLSLTSPINASIIMSIVPIVVMIAAFLLLGDRITWVGIAGLVIAAIGTCILIGWNGLDLSSDFFLGDLLILANALTYGVYLVLIAPLITKYPPIEVIKWVFLFGMIFILPFGLADLEEVGWEQLPQDIWLAIAYVAVMTTFVVYLLNAWAIRRVGSMVVGAYIYLQPILASLIAVAFSKDTMTLSKAILMGLIFAGVYLVSLSQRTKVKLPA